MRLVGDMPETESEHPLPIPIVLLLRDAAASIEAAVRTGATAQQALEAIDPSVRGTIAAYLGYGEVAVTYALQQMVRAVTENTGAVGELSRDFAQQARVIEIGMQALEESAAAKKTAAEAALVAAQNQGKLLGLVRDLAVSQPARYVATIVFSSLLGAFGAEQCSDGARGVDVEPQAVESRVEPQVDGGHEPPPDSKSNGTPVTPVPDGP